MIEYKPYRANMKIRYLVVVHIGQPVGVMNPIISLQAFRVIWLMLRNDSREAGLSVSLISGIWIVMNDVVRWLERVEHFNYACHAYQIFIILVASHKDNRPYGHRANGLGQSKIWNNMPCRRFW